MSEADLAPFDALIADSPRPGVRLAMDPAFAPGQALARALAPVTAGAQAVRAVAFNKTEGANWGVPWHQDRIIAVAGRHAAPGFGNWSQKRDVWHCEPPVALLERMFFVRLHLDPCGPENGPMEIAVGSHRSGAIPSDAAEAQAVQFQQEACLAARGDILILHMLTLHRSSPARQPSARRAIRIDYSADALPAPLEWAA